MGHFCCSEKRLIMKIHNLEILIVHSPKEFSQETGQDSVVYENFLAFAVSFRYNGERWSVTLR